jgi:Ser/Thr protein kinase RdoA (MazF antagonist)
LLGQIEVAGRYGAIFERLPGENPSPVVPVPYLDEIVSTLNMLHRDFELAALLGSKSRPARDTFLDYHMEMCQSDLEEIEPAVPLPFVDKRVVAWMQAETDALLRTAIESAAFDETVSNAIHGDLWFGNVLIDNDRWWIIDWDDLKIGDPAHDLSLILFTTLDDPQSASRWISGRTAAFAERFHLYARAALLTFVIDPIADWISAESFPEVRDAARVHREVLHHWALERYRKLYG